MNWDNYFQPNGYIEILTSYLEETRSDHIIQIHKNNVFTNTPGFYFVKWEHPSGTPLGHLVEDGLTFSDIIDRLIEFGDTNYGYFYRSEK